MDFRFSSFDSRFGCRPTAGAGSRPASRLNASPFRGTHCAAQSKIENPKSKIPHGTRGFTLLEILLALALVSLVLVAMNTFIFSMGELWGRNTDVRLFDQHVRAVTRFLQHELRTAALPPAAQPNSTPVGLEDVRPETGGTEKLLTFELPAGSRLFTWPDRPLPEVVCSLQVRRGEGLILLWHSRLEKDFDTTPPRETVVTPLVTAMSYDYFDPDTNQWSTETMLKMDPQGNPMVPQRLRLKFGYQQLTRETLVIIYSPGQALPPF